VIKMLLPKGRFQSSWIRQGNCTIIFPALFCHDAFHPARDERC